MNDIQVTSDILAKIAQLSSESVRLRTGKVTSIAPLKVSVAGSGDYATRTLDGQTYTVNDIILVAQWSGQVLALGRISNADRWHLVGTSGEPGFVNGWNNFGYGYRTCQFRKVGDMVHVRGLVSKPTFTPGNINSGVFTLPTGYRPTTDEVKICTAGEPSNSSARVDISASNGGVYINTTSGNAWVFLDFFYSLT